MHRIGILALQGDFEAHARAFEDLGVRAMEVRTVARLDDLAGLVIPGGESTTLLNLMRDEPWFDALHAFHRRGGALFGTCAGAILLCREVEGPGQPSLGLLDATIRRNGYGRQIDSFQTELDLSGDGAPLEAVFIRAPRFVRLGPGVETEANLHGEPVLVTEGSIMAGTFHPELTADRRLHRRFLQRVGKEFRGARIGEPGEPREQRRIPC